MNKLTALAQRDWLVLDSSAAMNKFPFNQFIDRMLVAFYKHAVSLSNCAVLKIPPLVYPLFELESLAQVNPTQISNYFLVHFSHSLVNCQEEFDSWLQRKCLQNKFFNRFSLTLKLLFVFFFQKYVDLHDQFNRQNVRKNLGWME